MEVKKIDLKLTLLLFLTVEPPYFSTISWVNSVYDYGQYLLFFSLIFLILAKKKARELMRKPSNYFIAFYIYLLWLSTYSRGSIVALQYIFGANKAAITFLLLLIYEFSEHPKAITRCLRNFDIYLYINFLTIMAFPNGLYRSGSYMCWFLGYKNPQIRIILPIVFYLFLSDYLAQSKISLRTIVDTICAASTTVITKSGTGLTGLLIFGAIIFIGVNLKFIYNKLLSIKTIVGSVIILVLAFVVYQIQYTNQIVSTIITEFYGKSLDFSARTLIWKRAIELIKDHLWLGYGYLDSYQNAQLFGFEWPVAHPHNYYLYLLLTGGILLLLLFLLIIADYAKKVKQHGYSKITVCTTAYIAAILVMGITESMTEFAMFYGALYLAIKCIEISGLETAHLEP